jgi:hypothetical protein
MKLSRRNFLNMAAGATLPAAPGIARAQTFPARPIRLVSPFPAGGPADTICRILGEHMHASLGQPVLVENTAGAGYTLIVGQWSTHVADAAIYRLPYDTLTDFEPIARAALQQSRADRRPKEPAGQRPAGTDRVAESQSVKGDAGHPGDRRHRPYRRAPDISSFPIAAARR